MKKNIILSMAMAMASVGAVNAQENDGVDPLIKINNKENTLNFTVGGRLMMDAAYLHSDYTPMNSGFAISDARIRTSMSYKQWYFFADFDFSGGDFKQKNIFARYNFLNNERGQQSIKFGYFCEPSTMSMNTSRFNYHFISRPSSVMSLAPSRSLGATYKFYNERFLFDQGVFAENKYNDQLAGFQGISASGRWIYRPINNENTTLHFGGSLRYAHLNTGEVVDGVFKTDIDLVSTLETAVDRNKDFLSANVPWAKGVINVGVEALYRSDRFFARGEYMMKRIYKERPDAQLFENQLGGVWSWTTLESWQGGNPLRTSKFDGGYVEAGFLLRGDKYAYDNEFGLIKGNRSNGALELVARYNYTNLNDINDGDFYLAGNGKFYPNGVVSDYPVSSTSIAGGRIHSGTIGLNYTINQYLVLMADYTYSNLDNVRYSMDKNIHAAQARIMFSF